MSAHRSPPSSIDAFTLSALADFPRLLEAHYAAIPEGFRHWAPSSWDGVPGEAFTAIEQVCHVRDIEIEGYQVRLRRTLAEYAPFLASIRSEAIAIERDYRHQDAAAALTAFSGARVQTLAMLPDLSDGQWQRRAELEGYGMTNLRGLLHFLCSHDQQHLAGLQWLRGKIEGLRAGAPDR